MAEAVNSKAIRAARVVSGLTQEQAADVLGVSPPTYISREKSPKAFTIDELEDLFVKFDDEGKRLVQNFVRDIFLL